MGYIRILVIFDEFKLIVVKRFNYFEKIIYNLNK